jgi:hypothetical protein
MNTLFFVVCIVAIACTAGVVTEYLKMRSRKEEGSADIDGTLAHMEELEERVRVLERVVTEKKFDLSKEIDKL